MSIDNNLKLYVNCFMHHHSVKTIKDAFGKLNIKIPGMRLIGNGMVRL